MSDNNKYQILIVEDDPSWQENILSLVDAIGLNIQCRIAPDYLTALRILQEMTPAIITLDLNLGSNKFYQNSNWDGWEIADLAQIKNIPIIMISSHANAEKINTAFLTYSGIVKLFIDKFRFIEQADSFIKTVSKIIIQQQVTQPIVSKKALETGQLTDFQHILDRHFNKAEIIELCFELKIEHENLIGDRKSDMIRELVMFVYRHGRLHDLRMAIQTHRPHVSM